MSSRQGVRSPARGVPAGGRSPVRGRAPQRRPAADALSGLLAWRLDVSRWSGWAWGAIAATAAYIALTCWWLTQDRSIPIYDAGDHLETALLFHQMLAGGELLGPLNHEEPYPPFGPLVGAFGAFVGGVNVAAPIVAENLVFVSLLTLGCYQTGRLLFNAKAGGLAAIFVLGSALLMAQFHVFMLDAPEAAMVAVSVWLILACDHFSRPGLAAAAGLAVGLGAATKVQYPSFVLGLLLIVLVRGGWRNRRGLATFAGAALVVGAPWYIDHLSQFHTFVKVSTANPIVVAGDIPPTFSLGNFGWYFWNILNAQLLVPLYTLLAVGTAWMAVTLYRHRRAALRGHLRGHPRGGTSATEATRPAATRAGRPAATPRERLLGARLEFFFGAFSAWAIITVTPSHDIRYAIPLLPYLAVIATGWIVHVPRAASWAAIAVLALGVVANTLGTTIGVGHTVHTLLREPIPPGEEESDVVTFYSTAGFLVAGPQRDGDVPGLLSELHHAGVTTLSWSLAQSRNPDFNTEGLLPLARIAELQAVITGPPEYSNSSSSATLLHESVSAQSPPSPCRRLSDGTGVWVVRANPVTQKREFFCPSRSPQYYGAPR
jgi:4-amino-4-deoxy-L-arabinose transferase-like glycosyltransferase